jgi:hypothetical protein
MSSALSKIPLQDQKALQQLSVEASDAITSPSALHVYEIFGEPDDLLFLTVQIEWLKSRSTSDRRDLRVSNGAVILASPHHRSFGRVVEHLQHLTGEIPQRHLNSHVALYNSTIAVVKIPDVSSGNLDASAANMSTKNLTFALGKLSKATNASHYVWHHRPSLAFLLHFINNTTPACRNALSALTVHASLATIPNTGDTDSNNNTAADWKLLERYARRLSIPIVLVNASNIPMRFSYLSHILSNFGEMVPALFPASVYTESVYRYIDIVHVCVYRIVAAQASRHSSAVSQKVEDAIPRHHDGVWAKACVRAGSYTPERCRMRSALEVMSLIAWYTDMGMMPQRNPTKNADAMARVLLGPGREAPGGMCVPIEIAFRDEAFRISSEGVFYVYTLHPAQQQGGQTSAAVYHSAVQGAVLKAVESFVKGYYERRKNAWGYRPSTVGVYTDGLAVVWGELYQNLIVLLRNVANSDEAKRWSEQEKNDVQSVISALGTGAFTSGVVKVLRAREGKGKKNGAWISG